MRLFAADNFGALPDATEFFMKLLSVNPVRLMLTIMTCVGFLGGCNRPSDQPVAKSQIVARIGDEVVTTQELDNEFRWANISPERQKDPEAVKKVLGDLVVRKYLLRQAIAAKLDREPQVLLDLLRSREQILETALIARRASAKAPGRADVDRYIANNPGKFAGRKLLNVEQVAFPLSVASPSFVDANKDVKSLDEIVQKLSAAAVPYNRQVAALSSNDLPPDLVSNLEAKKRDDVFYIRSGPNGLFMKVTGEEARPLEGEAAANLARQLMRSDATKAETGVAAYSANLEAKFEGEYAKIMQAGDARKN